MKAPRNVVRSTGHGTNVLLIHGTGTDGSSFLPLMRLLRRGMCLTSYDRRGTAGWPLDEPAERISVGDHARDAADLILDLDAGPVHVCGASFGGAIALELARSRPDLVASATLFEPAVFPSEEFGAVPNALLAEFERSIDEGKAEEAAERFQRRVLTDEVWQALPSEAKRLARGAWRTIHRDLVAGTTYRVRPSELAAVETKVLLLRGGRSRRAFEASLHALNAALPHSRLALLPSAGHHLSGEAWPELAKALSDFMDGRVL